MKTRLMVSFRLVRVALHLCHGLAVVGLVFPVLARSTKLLLKRRWSQRLIEILGVRLTVEGPAMRAPMRVANHVSWLDVFLINAMEPTAFVAKSEVERWPVLGYLARRTETMFMERGSGRASRSAAARIAVALAEGRCVAAFPEGTTTEGDRVLPFRSALFQAVVDAKVSVQPLAIRYFDESGRRSTVAAYCGETSLVESLVRLAATPLTHARITCLEPIAAEMRNRRDLARYCESAVVRVLEMPDSIEDGKQPVLGEATTFVVGNALAERPDQAVVDLVPAEV